METEQKSAYAHKGADHWPWGVGFYLRQRRLKKHSIESKDISSTDRWGERLYISYQGSTLATTIVLIASGIEHLVNKL